MFTFPVLSSELKLLHSGEARRARWGTEAVYFYAFLVFVAITGGRQEHTSFRKKFFFFFLARISLTQWVSPPSTHAVAIMIIFNMQIGKWPTGWLVLLL